MTVSVPLLLLLSTSCASLLFPRNVTLENPEQVVRNARLLIKDFNEMPDAERKSKMTRHGCHFYEKSELPASLQLDLRHAFVCEDRVSLVFHRNPDADLGLRIWRADVADKGSDKPSQWNEIYTYYFNNDSEVAIENLP